MEAVQKKAEVTNELNQAKERQANEMGISCQNNSFEAHPHTGEIEYHIQAMALTAVLEYVDSGITSNGQWSSRRAKVLGPPHDPYDTKVTSNQPLTVPV